MDGSGLPQIGQVVRSAAGRDSGTCYLVIRILDPRNVAVADGLTRSVTNPKKKNVRHLDFLPQVAESLKQRLRQGERVDDHEIQSVLMAYCEGGSGASGQG